MEMPSSKIATILQRNTHSIIFLLIYTSLEWILIVLLLLNALLSFLIRKFAVFFGLKPPCFFCSRIDHLFERGRLRSSYRDCLCESHAVEVSKMGFCSNHRRLADSGDMCEDCASSKPGEVDRSVPLLSWMKRSEQGEKDLRCSCCGVVLESGFYSPFLLIKTESLDVLEKQGQGEKEDGGSAFLSSRAVVEDALPDVVAFRVENMIDSERILPIELIDSFTMLKSMAFEIMEGAKKTSMETPSSEMQEKEGFAETELVAVNEKHSYAIALIKDPCHELFEESKDVELVEFDEPKGLEEDGKGNDEANCEISIGSEICDQEEQLEHIQYHEISSQPEAITHQNLNGLDETNLNDPEAGHSEQTFRRIRHIEICPAINEIEEEIIMHETPTTPTYMDSFLVLQKRIFLERRESGTESLDGSIASDLEIIEPPTVDCLKTALKSERNALIALYMELEEERNASAIAANQTMAMITRLQEEKAAMQMEALHYQRMMEEQAEYDQEALQLLNELMIKREKEKDELQKELEAFQQRVRVYETMERRKVTKKSGSGTFSSSEESDDISIMFLNADIANQTFEEDEDAVKSFIVMDDSSAEFEEERVFILEQLKVLVEKLFRLGDKDGSFNGTQVNHSSIENGHVIDANELEEVHHGYNRLETESEFLRHSFSSMKKGGGVNLLQEILLHLRDLRTVELRLRHIDA